MKISTDADTRLAIDAQGLNSLRLKARQSPDKALRQAAQQFEAVFTNLMLKSMRDATPQNGILDSDQTRTFTALLDQQLSQNLATHGIGLADLMVKQLSHASPAKESP